MIGRSQAQKKQLTTAQERASTTGHAGPTKEQTIERLQRELNAANNRIRELETEVHQIRPAYVEATRQLMASNLENAQLMKIIAQQAGPTPLLTILQALPLEDRLLLGAINQIFHHGRGSDLLNNMSARTRATLLKTALIMIRAIVKLLHRDYAGLLREISLTLAKEYFCELSLCDYINSKNAMHVKIHGQRQLSIESSNLLFDLHAQCLVSVNKLPQILLTCLGIFFGEAELTKELLSSHIPASRTLSR
jgi:hypothetical protein